MKTTDQIGLLSKMLEIANKILLVNGVVGSDIFGKCEWTDIDGNRRCNSPWSKFQCEQAGGVFSQDEECDN